MMAAKAPAPRPAPARRDLLDVTLARAAPLPPDDFDQTPAFDLADPEPVPEFDFDQTGGA